MHSIAEIDILEQAHGVGAPSLGVAAFKLMERWNSGLKDNETFIRLSFLCWYSLSEPTWYNGLPMSTELPKIDNLINDLGGIKEIKPESKFILAALATGYPWCLGDENKWSNLATSLPVEAAHAEPSSFVFKNWQYVLGLTKERNDLKIKIKEEFHARFHGRGYMGIYLCSIFGGKLGL